MIIKQIKRYNKEYNGNLYPRADIVYGSDPLVGRLTMTENTKVYREVDGMMCLAGAGSSGLKEGMKILPFFYVDKYGSHQLQSILIVG